MPELRLVVDEPRSTFDVAKLWLPRVALALAFVYIGTSKFDNDPRSAWVQIFARIGLLAPSAIIAVVPLAMLGLIVAVWLAGPFGAGGAPGHR